MDSVTVLQLHGVFCECCNDKPSRCVVLTKMSFSQERNNIFNNYYSIIEYIVVFLNERMNDNLVSIKKQWDGSYQNINVFLTVLPRLAQNERESSSFLSTCRREKTFFSFTFFSLP